MLPMQTVKIYQLKHLSHKQFQRLKATQMEAARVWKLCCQTHKEARTYLRPGLSRSSSSRADTPQCCLRKAEDQPRITDPVSSETGHTSDVA